MLINTLQSKGVIFLIVSVLLYSIMPVLIRLLGAGTLPPATQVFFRYIVACIVAWVYSVFTKNNLQVHPRHRLALIGIALIGYALTNLFYTYAILLTQIGTVLFIFFSASIMTPVASIIFLKETVTPAKIFAVIVAFIALLFLFQPSGIGTWKTGALFALLAALGQVVYVLGRKRLPDYSSSTILVLNTTVGVVAVGAIALMTEAAFYTNQLYAVSVSTWLLTALFGCINFFAWLFMTKGFALVSASTGSMVMLSENIFGMILAFLFFSEVPAAGTLIGGVLILIASGMVLVKR